jgi:dolichyl-phosphate beta-glucosyltransferase
MEKARGLTMRPEVSLVIASYNGGCELERTLCRVQRYFGDQPYLHEVLVVNDGSTDTTGACLHALSLHYPELKVLVNRRNMGKGYSIKRGVLEACGRFIFYTDADLAYPIEEIEVFLQPLRRAAHEAVVGSRVHAASRFQLHPRHFRYIHKRHLMSRFFNWLVRRLFGIQALDTQCGFKGFTAEAAKAIFSRIEIRGFTFDVEVLLIAHRLGYRVAELPVIFAYEGEVSTVKVLKIVCQTLIDLTRICWWDHLGKYADRV